MLVKLEVTKETPCWMADIGTEYGIAIATTGKDSHEAMIHRTDGVHEDSCYLKEACPINRSEEDSCRRDPMTNVTVHNDDAWSADAPGGT